MSNSYTYPHPQVRQGQGCTVHRVHDRGRFFLSRVMDSCSALPSLNTWNSSTLLSSQLVLSSGVESIDDTTTTTPERENKIHHSRLRETEKSRN